MSLTPQRLARLGLIAAAALSMAACASRPKPAGPAPAAEPPPAADTTPAQPSGPAPVTSSVIPGSPQDFAQNAGERVFFDLDSHELRSDALATLDAQAAWLARYPNVQVRIEGNADE